jgi:hypothetical protein
LAAELTAAQHQLFTLYMVRLNRFLVKNQINPEPEGIRGFHRGRHIGSPLAETVAADAHVVPTVEGSRRSRRGTKHQDAAAG